VEFLQGAPITDILERHQLTLEAFHVLINSEDLALKPQVRDELRRRAYNIAVQMYIDGKHLWEIELATSVQSAYLYKKLRQRGVPLRNRKL
jgi:hypothetical protein